MAVEGIMGRLVGGKWRTFCYCLLSLMFYSLIV